MQQSTNSSPLEELFPIHELKELPPENFQLMLLETLGAQLEEARAENARLRLENGALRLQFSAQAQGFRCI